MITSGDVNGIFIWRRIQAAIEDLLRARARDGEVS